MPEHVNRAGVRFLNSEWRFLREGGGENKSPRFGGKITKNDAAVRAIENISFDQRVLEHVQDSTHFERKKRERQGRLLEDSRLDEVSFSDLSSHQDQSESQSQSYIEPSVDPSGADVGVHRQYEGEEANVMRHVGLYHDNPLLQRDTNVASNILSAKETIVAVAPVMAPITAADGIRGRPIAGTFDPSPALLTPTPSGKERAPNDGPHSPTSPRPSQLKPSVPWLRNRQPAPPPTEGCTEEEMCSLEETTDKVLERISVNVVESKARAKRLRMAQLEVLATRRSNRAVTRLSRDKRENKSDSKVGTPVVVEHAGKRAFSDKYTKTDRALPSASSPTRSSLSGIRTGRSKLHSRGRTAREREGPDAPDALYSDVSVEHPAAFVLFRAFCEGNGSVEGCAPGAMPGRVPKFLSNVESSVLASQDPRSEKERM